MIFIYQTNSLKERKFKYFILEGIPVNERVTTKQAAMELHMDICTLQCLMKNGQLPIGYALKKDGKTRHGYYIYRGLLDAEKKRLGLG